MGTHSWNCLAVVPIALVVAAGCRTPTQVTVELTTDVPCSELPNTTARVGRLGAELESRAPSVVTLACAPNGRIGSFVVAPSGELGDEFAVKVVLAHGSSSTDACDAAEQNGTKLAGCIRARRALRFSPHDELMLPIALRQDCDSVLCPELTTCVHGECRPATIPDPRLCQGAGCSDTTLQPGSSPDGGTNMPPSSSCANLSADCGSTATDNCCNSPLLMGGTFGRDNGVQTTVSSFRLNKYEVTVGRFRAFVDAAIAGYTPANGSGKHAYLAGGGLINLWDMGNLERGWVEAWNMFLPTDKFTWDDVNHLGCVGTSWTSKPGTNEQKPVTCVNWFQAYAFCIWDGGFLPSYNEFSYARVGGEAQRPYPWGSDPITPDRATYCSSGDCMLARPSDVGSKPTGDGLFFQSDLVGSVSEFVLDGFNGLDPCKDCMSLADWPPQIVPHIGGAYNSPPDQLELRYMWTDATENGLGDAGFRCALPP
jgi:formylglycine-generating enzyme required for sulfatase activity